MSISLFSFLRKYFALKNTPPCTFSLFSISLICLSISSDGQPFALSPCLYKARPIYSFVLPLP